MAGRGCGLLAMAVWLFAGRDLARGQTAENTVFTVRVLPAPLSTNVPPLRLGFQTGLSGDVPLRAEGFLPESLGTDGGVTLKTGVDPATGLTVFFAENTGKETAGLSLSTRVLRRKVGCTVSVACRFISGRTRLCFAFEPVGGLPEERVEKKISVKDRGTETCRFAVVPVNDGAYRCVFALEPGSVMAFSGFSLKPDDAEGGWSHPVLEALRNVGPWALRWPVETASGFYNWYDGVGPSAMRRAASPAARDVDEPVFGTDEFVGLCRLLNAEPVIRVTVFQPEFRSDRVPDSAAGIQLAADWVAYCNAAAPHPLAQLRERYGRPAPLDVKRWELVTPDGHVPDASVCRAYAAAMTAEDPAVIVRPAAPALAPRYDRYVAQVRQRLAVNDAARGYYGTWYDALGIAYAAMDALRRGTGRDLFTAFCPEQVLYRVPYAKNMVTETGVLFELFNAYPAQTALNVEGLSPDAADESVRVQAAWTADASTLVIFVYNSGVETRKLQFDLRALHRSFGFWIADQLAGDITRHRPTLRTVPVNRIRKAGAAITQWVACEAEPSSLTRILVKE